MVSTRGASAGKPVSSKPPSRWWRVPRRRSTVATSRRINARSRSGSEARPGMGGFAGQLFVERNFPPQDAVENVGGNPSGGEAGDFRLRGGARSRHVRIIAHELWLGREPDGKNLTPTQIKPPSHASYGGI